MLYVPYRCKCYLYACANAGWTFYDSETERRKNRIRGINESPLFLCFWYILYGFGLVYHTENIHIFMYEYATLIFRNGVCIRCSCAAHSFVLSFVSTWICLLTLNGMHCVVSLVIMIHNMRWPVATWYGTALV